MTRELFLAALFSINSITELKAQQISTICGNGSAAFSGNNGPATAAALNRPFGIALDEGGSLFIADRLNNMIRKIGGDGSITTIAGNGTPGYSGDGSAATDAQINNPTGVAVDKAGNVYIADLGNHCIRRVSLSGMITTIAGTGIPGYNGESVPATTARLSAPRSVCIDMQGNIIVADAGNHRVRRISADGTIHTIAGTGVAGFSGDGNWAIAANLNSPYSAFVDHPGNLYIADVDNQRIRRVSTDGIISTVAGNGNGGYNGDNQLATSASLFEPIGVVADRMGNVYIADGWNNRIRYIDVHSGTISTIAGNGMAGYNGDDIAATAAQLNNPYGVTVDSRGNFFIADYSNNRIRKVTPPAPLVNDLKLIIFPNPSFGGFAIKAITEREDQVAITITDLAGRTAHKASIEPNTIVDLATPLAAGMYYIKASNPYAQAYGRLIIIH